uniref:Metallophosphoesterase domain-containing protein 1 n=1 Tax=Triatoma infestans TaxID=30076 RepID=A0A170W633_TRIIF
MEYTESVVRLGTRRDANILGEFHFLVSKDGRGE